MFVHMIGFTLSAGQRIIKVAKSPMSPPLAFPFHITSAGISLLSDNGTELKGPGINTIHARGITDPDYVAPCPTNFINDHILA